MGLSCDPEHGGQGLPLALATPVIEMWNSACMGWALCPLLTHGAINMLEAHGSPEQKRLYLEKLVSGEWAGTMNLTGAAGRFRPSARCAPARCRHMTTNWGDPLPDYRRRRSSLPMATTITATTSSTWSLARTPDAPPGSRGISLFLVPKFLLDADGKPGERNDLRPLRLEEKLGIHASPTCVMSYGDGDGAIGWRIGEENRGLEAMFTMMNSERLLVGVQGVAIAEARLSAGTRLCPQPRTGAPCRRIARRRGAADRAPPRCAAHAAGAPRRGRGDARARLLRRRRDRPFAPRDRRANAVSCRTSRRSADPGVEGVVHGSRRRDRLDRRSGAWRNGLHRRNRRRPATMSRRSHRADLRRHDGDTGQRSGRPQAGP